MSKKLIDGIYPLQRFPGKGGWTYATIPEVVQDKHAPFGWVKVRGSIDDHPLEQYKLMPMGEGRLFLPVKAAIRKQIRKASGDSVHIVLFADNSPIVIPEELKDCFALEPPSIWETFCSLSEGEQKRYIDWIYDAKKVQTRVKRITQMMKQVASRRRLGEKS